NIQVSIPAGIDEGQQIRVSGKGEPGKNGGPPGDLFVVIVIQPHEYFNREGDHIFLELPITFAQAALGDEISVPTVHGKVMFNIQVSIPAGIDEGQQIRVSGKGEPGKNGGPPGDLFVVIVIQPHEYFNREGDHIFLELPITFAQAALGDEISVPTVHGKVMF